MTIYHAEKLQNVDKRLVDLVKKYGEYVDLIIVCGHRGEAEQNACYKNNTSNLKWPHSKHNKIPSMAVDLAPTFDGGKSIPWRDLDKWVKFCEEFETFANRNGVRILGGHNFKAKDYPHWEIV